MFVGILQSYRRAKPARVLRSALITVGLVSAGILHGWFVSRNAGVPDSSKLACEFQAGSRSASIGFESNQGQAEARVRYLSRGRGYSLLLTDTEAVVGLASRNPLKQSKTVPWVHLRHLGATLRPRVTGSERMQARSHYFLGNDPRVWKTDIPHFAKVTYQDVYPGVDVVYYGSGGQLEYDYVVAAGVDPGVIALEFQGVDALSIDAGGDLKLAAGSGELRLKRPRAYQWSRGQARPIESAYRLEKGNRIRFELGAFDPSSPVVIDPVLTYSTYLGGRDDDRAAAIAMDAEGNAYLTGTTLSANFPQSGNASSAGGEDVFVSKLNPAGNALIYSAYLGGLDADVAKALAVDPSGSVYVTGGTRSSNFPVTPGALQPALRGASDAFVLKLNPAGNQLVYSTYLGGTRDEGFEGGGIALAGAQAYITGGTNSLDFPTSRITFQRNYGGGGSDAFVTRLNDDGKRLVYSTYLGGFDLDEGRGIAVDSGGRAYVTGRTRSPNLIVHNGYQALRRSTLDDGFLTKFNASGDLVTYSTFLGGSGNEAANAVAVDDSGLASVAGESDSTDFTTTDDAIKKEHGGSDLDGFIVKLRTTASKSSSLVYASFFGGNGNDAIRALAVRAAGALHIAGVTDSTDLPTQAAAQGQFGGGATDAFVAELNSIGTGLVYSSYLGGAGADSAESIAILPPSNRLFDVTGSAWVAGTTESSNFPTALPLQPQAAGKKDVFTSRVPAGDGSPAAPIVTAGIVLDPASSPQVAQTLTATFTLTNQGGSTAFLKAVTLLENDPDNDVPNFPPLRFLVIEPGDSIKFSRSLVLTRTGTFSFKAAYQIGDSSAWINIPAAEGSTSQVDATVENTSNAVGPVNAIDATANPCEIPFGKDTCTVDLTWTIVNAEAPQLRVQDVGVGGPETLFSLDASGKVTINWIQGFPHRYKFAIYDVGGGAQRELGFMELTAQEGNPPPSRGTLSASSNPCEIPAGAAACTTTVTWKTIDEVANAILYVQDIGFGHLPSAIEAGKTGTVELSWIQAPPHRYIFTLFEVTATGRTTIAALEVTGKEESKPASPSGTISAAPRSCTIPSGGSSCSTVVSWSTTNDVSDARVFVTDAGASGSPVLVAKGKTGTVRYDGIEASPHRYVFTLYGLISNRLVELGSVEASGAVQ